jgi:hypothetical protein
VLPRKFKMVLTPAVSGVGSLGGEVLTAMSVRAGLNGRAVRRRLFALAKLRGFEPLAFPAETSRRILSILYDMTDREGRAPGSPRQLTLAMRPDVVYPSAVDGRGVRIA